MPLFPMAGSARAGRPPGHRPFAALQAPLAPARSGDAPDAAGPRRVPRGGVPLLVATLMLALFTLLRLGLLLQAGPQRVAWADWPSVLARGLWFDLAVIGLWLSPVWLYEALLPMSWRARAWHRRLRAVWLTFSVALLLFGVVAEITFWIEFNSRFNFIAVDYLLYTHEVVDNIRESYPVNLILLCLGVLAAGIASGLWPWLRRADAEPPGHSRRLAMAGLAVLAPTLVLSLVRSEQAEGLGSTTAEEAAGNGLWTLGAALYRNELDYDRHYATLPQARADAVLAGLGVERPALSAFNPDRSFAADPPHGAATTPFRRRPRHLVLISVESLSADFMQRFGNTQGLTPNLDRLAREGLFFDRLYATGTRTVRGLEALSLGTPPVPGQAIVRRPRNSHLSTLGEALAKQGFESLFLYGGFGYFDNMNAYFGANHYRVLDRTDFPKASVPFANVWGVADEALFDNALATLDRETTGPRRVFAHVLTTSNHRPFTYPDGRIDIPSPGGREGAVKYTDWAIGRFLEQARRRPWFDDTLFVVVADHCAGVAGKTRLPVRSYHIPMLFYAPGLLPAGTYGELASQIDLAPTLIDVLGLNGDNLFFGRSLFDDAGPPGRAFISTYQELGYLKADRLTVLKPGRRVESFAIDRVTSEATPAAVDPTLRDEAIAYYQTAARAFGRGALDIPAPLHAPHRVSRSPLPSAAKESTP